MKSFNVGQKVKLNDPTHPWRGQEFEVIEKRQMYNVLSGTNYFYTLKNKQGNELISTPFNMLKVIDGKTS